MSEIRTPVVFIHGLWLHASSWEEWVALFREKGFDPIAPGWPNEPDTVEAARRDPEAVAGLGIEDITAHYASIIDGLDQSPVIVGHSFGGLIAQKLLDGGRGIAGVAIDPAQIKGVKALPFSALRSGFPALGNPANKHRAVALTERQFRYAFGNAVSEEESTELFERWGIPSPGRPLFEAAFANFAPNSPAAADTRNDARGPLLLVSGLEDHTVPDAVTRGTVKQYRHSDAITDLEQMAGRGHSLTIDHGWHEVADYVLGWLARQGVRSVRSDAEAS